MKALLWLRRDLRLQDNSALSAAMASDLPVEALYIYPDDPQAPLAEGAAARWYLHQSLLELQRRLAQLGVILNLYRGDPEAVITRFCTENEITKVFFNRIIDPQQAAHDLEIQSRLKSDGVACEIFADDCLVMPEDGLKADGTPYRVFTPFWRNLLGTLHSHSALAHRLSPVPLNHRPPVKYSPRNVDALQLRDAHPWHQQLHNHWQPGERSVLQRLANFVGQGLDDYQVLRDRPDLDGTSRLSPALHFGEVSVVQVFARVDERLISEGDENVRASMRRFQAELGWREFSRHVLHAFPHTRKHSMNPLYDQEAAWASDPGDQKLRAWKRAETGIALVDAGMRQLWETGWMHNRVRMVVASFLTKNLGIHWRKGARWFADTLVDADVASNTLGWQWVTGCGTDAAPYYRIFNPSTQARKFDPEGRYVSRWLGDQPLVAPITDLKASRARALDRYQDTIRRATA